MRFATVRVTDGTAGAPDGGTRAVRIEGSELVALPVSDVGQLLALPDPARAAACTSDGPRMSSESARFAPLVTRPGKIICVGLNYRNHILEMGRTLPEYPTLFGKYAEALIGSADPIVLPPESDAVDWEAELAVIIGTPVRRADEVSARRAIAGFSVFNDVTMRDWQYRTPMWLQGKTFESTSPLGPYLVTPDELPGEHRPDLTLSCAVDDQQVQSASTADLVFDPVALVRYISTVVTLQPGDVIATGTPGGVGHARTPATYLAPGMTLTTRIEHLGTARNPTVSEPA